MSRDDLAEILRGDTGDPERIDELSIRNTLLRFDAVRWQWLKLRAENALIAEDGWGSQTYQIALEKWACQKVQACQEMSMDLP